MKTISIVMATYNGGKYIKEQLDSIIPYMESDDELLISDDGSKDDTIDIVNSYAKNDKRILIVPGPKKGVVKNFENVLFKASKDIIMFSDQDDVWMPEKLSRIRKIFEEHSDIELIHHDKYICSNEQIKKGENGTAGLLLYKKWRHGVLNNLLYSCYFGCCMAMKREFIKSIIPFPDNTIAYDQLVGLVAEHNGTSYFLEEPLIKRRVHGDNMSQHLPYIKRIMFRFKVWRSYKEVMNNMKHREYK